MNTDNKTPEEAMPEDKAAAASMPSAGESSAQNTKPEETPAAQPAASAETANAAAQDDDAAKKQDSASPDAKPMAQSADVNDAKDDAKDAKDAKVEKRGGGGPRRVSGIVIGNKADKTARVRIERRVKHALYGKIVRRRTHLQAHDADNKCNIGDMVILEESPRFSKTKSWRVIAITPGEGR